MLKTNWRITDNRLSATREIQGRPILGKSMADASRFAPTGFPIGSFLVLLVLLIGPLNALVSAEPNESSAFSTSQDISYYNTGFLEGNVNIGEGTSFSIRIDYPSANGSGEMAEMAWDGGPFPVVVFFVDEGEDTDNYGWITQSIASAGFIVATPEDRWDSDETEDILDEMWGLYTALTSVNQSGFEDGNEPDNFIGGFDLDHWGVGGHGVGGALAAITQVGWDFRIENDSFPPPRALFGLGLEKADMPSISSLMPHVPKPSYSLFLTGTVDDIAPAHQNVQVMLQNWPGGWHFMEVLGANHLQYQDDSTFIERLSDGSATMSKSEQQIHALDHVTPYLNLILKGDHSAWLAASNRESNASVPSDVASYLEEDLSLASLLHVADAEGPGEPVELGEVANFSMVTMYRNGVFISANETGYSFTCSVIGHEYITVSGQIDPSTARSKCSLDLDSLPPNMYTVLLSVSINGMPASLQIPVLRGNTGMVLSDPIPAILIAQHSQTIVSASEFASDPDGQPINFHNATWMGEEGSKFNFSIAGENMTIAHTSDPEWFGSALLAINLIEANTANPDIRGIVVQVSVSPVDDQVVSLGQIPSHQMAEDGEPLVVDAGIWFSDPEGAEIVVEAYSSDANLIVVVTGSNLTLTSVTDWFGAAVVFLNVSDGTTAPISQTFPVQITATDDEPKYNSTAWNISMVEDVNSIIDLATLVWDPDGVEMDYIFTADEGIGEFGLLIEEGILTLQPPANWYGELVLGWLNASDGNTTIGFPLQVNVTPVNDIPQVQWESGQVELKQLNIVYSYLDADDVSEHILRFRIDDSQWLELPSNCEPMTNKVSQCTFEYNASELSHGGHSIELSISDGGHISEVERQIFTIAEDESQASDGLASMVSNPSTWAAIVGILVVLLLSKTLFSSNRRPTLAGAIQDESSAAQTQSKEVIDIDEQPSSSSGSGLLARAENLQGKS